MRDLIQEGIIIFLLTFFSGTSISCQEYYFRHYEVADGLSHSTVHSTLQDDRGFMWFGTKNGLNRFDGHQFKTYQSTLSDSLSLGSNFIECLDFSSGELWVGTDKGLYRYDPVFDHFYLLNPTKNNPILDVENDQNGNLWYISTNTLFQYNRPSKRLKEYTTPFRTPIAEITKSPNGDIWVASTTGLYKYMAEEDSFFAYPIDPALDNDLPFIITKIYALDDQTIAVGTMSHGAYLYDVPNRSFIKIQATTDKRIYVRDFLKKDNDLWIGTESGIFIYNLISKEVKHLKKDFNDPYALSDNAVYSLAMDRTGGIWAGTYFGGVNYFTSRFTTFKKYFPKVSENSISGEAVREIKEDYTGNLWIGTEDAGLNKLNPQTGRFQNFTFENTEIEGTHQNIHAILPLEDKIWIGTFQNGLFILDRTSGKVLRQFKANQSNGLRSNFILGLYKSSDGIIYVITNSGIQFFDEEENRFLLFDAFPEDYFYTTFLEDSQGGLWAGTYWDGLFYFNPKTGTKKVFKEAMGKSGSISNNAINGIFEDRENNIWISTENGLNLLPAGKFAFKRYTMENGFPSNVFYAMLEDNQGSLWITTANGLAHFTPSSEEVNIYKEESGLLSSQFNYNSAYKAPNGQLYFGTVKGIISFDPNNPDFAEQTFQAATVLTGLQINNREVVPGGKDSPLKKSITATQKLELTHKQSSFSIEFATLYFDTPGLIEYAYRLDESSSWVEIGNNHRIFFNKLSPGAYTLYLKSILPNGVWSTPHKALEIYVSPPFWTSNLAYALYVLLGVLALFFSIRFYHQKTEAKNAKKIERHNHAKEKEIYKAKIEFFTNVSHEILTPLTLIKTPLEKIIKSATGKNELKEDLSIMQKNTSRLLELVQQLLDFRKTEMERLELTFVETNLDDLTRSILQRFHPLITEKKIDVSYQVEQALVCAFVDVEAVTKIISNLVQNSIKYGQRKIEIFLKKEEAFVEICIKNDGYLIPASLKKRIFEPFYRLAEDKDKAGTGIGLSLAYSLTELHGGSLLLDMGDPKLNTFRLQLPVHQKNEFKLYPSNKWVLQNGKSVHKPIKGNPGHRSAILLVEDNQDLLDFLAKDLMTKYLVLKATNAKQAFKIIKNESIQLIISDVMMPGMNGFDMCEKIKTDIETSHIPIVLLTSKTALHDRIEGLEAGADAYIPKPFSMDHLKIQIENLLKNRAHVVEHFSSSPLAHIRSVAHTKTDETFIENLDGIIQQNMADHNLNVEALAGIMNMSRSTLYRKIKDLTNLSPKELINLTRLKKSAELLKTNKYLIYEISDMVGYNSPTIFGRNFQKQFNMTPTEYLNMEEKKGE